MLDKAKRTSGSLPFRSSMEDIPIFHKSVASDFPIPEITISSLMVYSLVIASD